MAERPHSNRREFLTGKAIGKSLRGQADEVLDAILDGDSPPAVPRADDTIRLETRAMACQWSVIMNPGPPRQVMVASDALDLVHAAEDLLTVYREDSETSRVNQHAAKGPISVSGELFRFLEACRALWEETDRAFDPSMGGLIQLWRQARREGKIPSQEEIDRELSSTGMQHVVLDPERETAFFEVEGVRLDFAAIGKGYAIDLVRDHLLSEEVNSFLVHGGHSSIFGHGDHAGHRGWPVGIKNPLFPEKRYGTLLLRDQGMSTSGSNVQYFRYGGRRYGHLLDPRNGWPAEGLLSVTVIAPSAVLAEALSTAFYVMGLDKARQYCDDHPNVGAILVPPPLHGRTLQPVVCNLPQDQFFLEEHSGENTGTRSV